jgi:hypothetical protein
VYQRGGENALETMSRLLFVRAKQNSELTYENVAAKEA